VGTPEQAKGFRVLAGWKGPMVVDAKGEGYRAAALRRISLVSLLRPSIWLAAMRARRQGFRQKGTQGDPWQLGGVLVVAPGDRVVYAYRDASPQDAAPLDAVVAALHGAP
jgi:hypothetical protein